MKRGHRFALIVTLAIAIAAAAFVAFESRNPLRMSEVEIQNQLLREVPLGGSMDEVLAQIGDHHTWRIVDIDVNQGFLHQRVKPAQVVGARSIRVEAGDYQGIPWRMYVTVFWGFDEFGRLEDVWVWKTQDTL